jgi:uncharacterized protein (TIGR04255 family)
MGRKMQNAPIYYALAQVRFNPLAAIETYIPAVQETLRKAGYPDFRPNQIAQLVFGAPTPKTTVVTRYEFLNAARTSGFILDQSWMSYQTTDYDTVDPFLVLFLTGLDVLHKEAALSYSDRIGIRFLDAVCPLAGETMSQYLQPYILGLSHKLEGRQLTHSVSETRSTLGKTTLIGRAVIHRQDMGPAALPEDLQPSPLQLVDKFSKISGEYAIIDTDSWIEDRQNFEVKALETTVRMLHETMRWSFDSMITPHALKVWS